MFPRVYGTADCNIQGSGGKIPEWNKKKPLESTRFKAKDNFENGHKCDGGA